MSAKIGDGVGPPPDPGDLRPAGRVEVADRDLVAVDARDEDRRAERAVGGLREQLDAEPGQADHDVRPPVAVHVADVDGLGPLRVGPRGRVPDRGGERAVGQAREHEQPEVGRGVGVAVVRTMSAMPSLVTSPMATASGSEPTGVTWYGPNWVPEATTPAGTIASSDSNRTDAIANTEIRAAGPAPVRRRRICHSLTVPRRAGRNSTGSTDLPEAGLLTRRFPRAPPGDARAILRPTRSQPSRHTVTGIEDARRAPCQRPSLVTMMSASCSSAVATTAASGSASPVVARCAPPSWRPARRAAPHGARRRTGRTPPSSRAPSPRIFAGPTDSSATVSADTRDGLRPIAMHPSKTHEATGLARSPPWRYAIAAEASIASRASRGMSRLEPVDVDRYRQPSRTSRRYASGSPYASCSEPAYECPGSGRAGSSPAGRARRSPRSARPR